MANNLKHAVDLDNIFRYFFYGVLKNTLEKYLLKAPILKLAISGAYSEWTLSRPHFFSSAKTKASNVPTVDLILSSPYDYCQQMMLVWLLIRRTSRGKYLDTDQKSKQT